MKRIFLFLIILVVVIDISIFAQNKTSGKVNGFLNFMNVGEDIVLELTSPDINSIRFEKELINNSDSTKFNSDLVVSGAKNDESLKTCSFIYAKGKFAMLTPLLSDKMISNVGLPTTRLEISSLKKGIYYANIKWFPVADKNCFIICKDDEIIGVNVRTEPDINKDVNGKNIDETSSKAFEKKNKPNKK